MGSGNNSSALVILKFEIPLSLVVTMWLICPIAGVGSQLAPFTFTKPKALLKVAGKRVIDHLMLRLQRTFEKGTHLVFLVGHKKKQVSEYLVNAYSNDFHLHFVEQKPVGYRDEIPYFAGLGEAIYLTREVVAGHPAFIFLGDRLPLTDYSTMVTRYLRARDEVDGIVNVQQSNHPHHYGNVQLNADQATIKCIVEKPVTKVSDLVVAGAYVFSRSTMTTLFEVLAGEVEQNRADPTYPVELTPAIQAVVTRGGTLGINPMADVLDFGRPRGLLEANRALLRGLSHSHFDLKAPGRAVDIRDSKIIPPVYLGRGTRVERSVIGPHVSVGDDCVVSRSVLADAVVGDGVNLARVVTRGTILGDYATLEDLVRDDVIVGDSSSIAASPLLSKDRRNGNKTKK